MAKSKKGVVKKTTKGQEVRNLLAALTGRTADDGAYVDKKIYGRAGTSFAKVCGKVTNTSMCRLEGCSGCRLHILWPDGHRTYPCAEAVKTRDDGDLEIV